MPTILLPDHDKAYNFENILTIGNHPSNDICIEDTQVFYIHAVVIQASDGKYFLLNQAVRNHTRVGGKPVQKYVLTDGTTFQIGDYSLIFQSAKKKVLAPVIRQTKRIHIRATDSLDSKTTPVDLSKKHDDAGNGQNRMALLLDLIREFSSVLDYDELIDKVLNTCIGTLDGTRGFIALKDSQNELRYESAFGFAHDLKNLEVSKTMIDEVVCNGLSILTANALHEAPFSDKKSVVRYNIKSVLCVPLTVHEKILGCIYIDNPNQTETFDKQDLTFLTILAQQIAIAVHNARLYKQTIEIKDQLREQLSRHENIIFRSKAMMELYQKVQKVARSTISTLILGETGSGKELVAKAIHRFSERPGEFVAINCAAITETLMESEMFGHVKGAFNEATDKKGKFEVANNGTLFLDEIGDMDLKLQSKILRVMETGQVTKVGGNKVISVNVRIVSATNRNLKEMVENGDFREDLYYRLAGIVIEAPPLRKRKEDIPILVYSFLSQLAKTDDKEILPRISSKVMKLWMQYDWPGNVRQLRQAVHIALTMCDGKIVRPGDVPGDIVLGKGNNRARLKSLKEMEKEHIRKVLAVYNGNKSNAAKILGIKRSTLYEKIEKYGLS